MRVKSSRLALCLGFVCLTAWGLPACSDDDDGGGSSGTGGSAGSTGGSAGTTGGSAGTSGGSAGTGGSAGSEFTCVDKGGDPPTTDNCVGEEAALQATYGPDNKGLAEITGDCARSPTCLPTTGAENTQCVNDCVQAIVQGAVSEKCTECGALSATCSKTNCVVHCIDPANVKCTPCRCACECVSLYDKCAGVPSSTTCP